MMLRTHKSFSEIESDIRYYYENGTVDAHLIALKIAGRALSVALTTARPEHADDIAQAKQIVFDAILDRQRVK